MNSEESQFDIDLVYLWVDGNDPRWRAKRREVIGSVGEDTAVNCEGRYANNDELMYSLRSVAMYAPWIRRIFIVTDAQVPAWLDTSNPKIRIVDHTEILPAECLPTFNSVVLEHAIAHIPGLSEYFLYANDDTFFNRPVKPSDFFAPDGLPIIRLTRKPLRKLSLYFREKILGRQLSNYNRTIHRAASLVESKYGVYVGGKPHHNIDAYCKSQFLHVLEEFRDVIEPTLTNHVRSADDVQRSIYAAATIAERRGHRCYVGRRTSFHVHIDNHTHYEKLQRYNPMLFCLNDSQCAVEADRHLAKSFLSHRFPTPSPYEK